ncbi:MAG: ABC transporter permease [Gemmatimonadetes bacterium]|nr:ABC transporter permease [Gemmatimonadota bacterium]
MSAIDILAQVLRIAVPYLFAAAGGVLSERAGIVALTLEGYLIAGGFGAAVATYYTNQPWVGLLAAPLLGAAIAGIHALATIRYKADQVVSGVAINLLMAGAGAFFLRLMFDSSANSPRIPALGDGLGSGLAATFGQPLVWMAFLALPATWWLLERTAFGLRTRAVGEHPQAATSLGVSVSKIRVTAVLLSGAVTALGGAYLAFDQHKFTDGMSAGRGFIALAAVIFGRWEAPRALVACLLFAAAETLQIRLQGSPLLPSQFVEMIPYVLTIVALAGFVGKSAPPAALGKAEG